MTDSYVEVVVHDEKDKQGKLANLGMVILTIVLLVVGFLMFEVLILMIGIAMIPFTVISIKERYREYEYLLVSGEMEIAVVKSRKKRKTLKTYTLSELQCMAPVTSHRLDGVHGNPQLKTYDYTSGNPDHMVYSMIFNSEGTMQEVKVEPSEAMLADIRMHHAGLLFTD